MGHAVNTDDGPALLQAALAAEYINMQDHNGYTALTWAAISGHVDVVQALVDAKAAIDTQGKDGMTPLMWAAYYERKETVAKLLDLGASKNKRNNSGQTFIVSTPE